MNNETEKIDKILKGNIKEDEIFSKKTVYNKDILEAIHLLMHQNRKIIQRLDVSNGKVKMHGKLIFGLYGLAGTVLTGLVIFFLTRLII